MNRIAAGRRYLACLLALGICPIAKVRAQSAASLRVGLTAPAPAPSLTSFPLRIEGRTHWKAGFLLGTIVGAVAIYSVGISGIDSFTPRVAVGLVALGSLVGGVPGALIGGQFPKRDSPESP